MTNQLQMKKKYHTKTGIPTIMKPEEKFDLWDWERKPCFLNCFQMAWYESSIDIERHLVSQ